MTTHARQSTGIERPAPAAFVGLDRRTWSPGQHEVLAFLVVRNEESRLRWTLDHHRRLGVNRFVSQVLLIRWRAAMRLAAGRHRLSGTSWRRPNAVGGALLHVKLTADLAARTTENAREGDGASAPVRANENRVEPGRITPLAGL